MFDCYITFTIGNNNIISINVEDTKHLLHKYQNTRGSPTKTRRRDLLQASCESIELHIQTHTNGRLTNCEITDGNPGEILCSGQ